MNKARLEAFSDGVLAIVNGAYVIAIAVAFFSPLASELIFTSVILGISVRTLRERINE